MMSRKLFVLGCLAAQSQSIRNSFTPGASEATNAALNETIGSIRSQVQSKIEAGFLATQKAVDQHHADFTGKSTTSKNQREKAVKVDHEWFMCVRSEKNLLSSYEKAEKEAATSRSNEDAPCQEMEDSSPFSWKADPEDLEFSCDIPDNDNDDCDTELNNYKTQLDQMVSDLESEMKESDAEYQVKKTACERARQETISKQSVRDDRLQEWKNKRSSCQRVYENRGLELCKFGDAFAQLCQAADDYSKLLVAIDTEKGDQYSRPDRKKEWSTSVITSCMLEKIIQGAKIDGNTLSECKNSVDYETSVGKLDTKIAGFEDLMSETKTNCAKTEISFEGRTWEYPTKQEPASQDYKLIKPHTETFSLVGEHFSFCT